MQGRRFGDDADRRRHFHAPMGFVPVSPYGIHQERRMSLGGTPVQIAEYFRPRQRIVEHARRIRRLSLVCDRRARELLEVYSRDVLERGAEPRVPGY